jgi:NTE family protein
MSDFSIGLALGGGGARGAAHIGVIKVLHDSQIKIDKIGGTSAGSIIGAMYAATKDPQWVHNRYREFLNSEEYQQIGTKSLQLDRDPDSVFDQIAKFVQDRLIIAVALNRDSIIKRKRLEKAIEYLLPVDSFEKLEIPLHVFSTDLQTGESICHKSGNLIEAVVQSSSIPGFVQPTKKNGQLFVDGTVTVPIPVIEMKKETDFVIAVNISRGKPEPLQKINIVEIISRTGRVASLRLTDMMVEKADFVFQPDVLGLHWSQFDKFDELLENGLLEGKQNISRLIDRLKHHKSWRFRLKQKLFKMN